MPDETQKERHAPHVLTTLAGVLIAFLLPTASAFQRAPQWQRCTATLRRLRCACS